MTTQNYNVIGLMSGTSLDGIDLAHILFEVQNNKWHYQLLECETVAYSKIWLETLKTAVNLPSNQLEILNSDYTKYVGETIVAFIKKYNIQHLDAVCSHGHTILHQPQNGFTLQIGNLADISKICRQKVVCDFRVQDVQLGGQGAPLVPIGDMILFAEYDFCLNLGGFSNISYSQNKQQIAFDISAVNTVLNFYANQLGFDFDDNGAYAKSGKIHNLLLNQLNNLPFYSKKPPKSLGIEYVNSSILPLIDGFSISIIDKLATFCAHIAFQIALVLQHKSGKLLITGGGAYNGFLIDLIQNQLPNIEVVIPNKKTIEFKEALVFGLLGVLKIRNQTNVLASVTGAKHDHCSGKIFEKPYLEKL